MSTAAASVARTGKGTAVPAPPGNIQTLFEAQARRHPERVAVQYLAQTQTYAELNASANKLARRLRQLGAGPEALVAVCVQRSLDLVAALMGVLKAGAAYVPLDPGYPPQRLHAMLEEARPLVLVTQEALLGRFESYDGRCLCIDWDADAIAALSSEDLGLTIRPEAALYCIFTSGSTGRPKGVIGTHGATLNRIAWMDATYPLEESGCVVHRTALSFVDSVCEIFGPLATGGRVAVLSAQALADADRMASELDRAGADRMTTVPSLMSALVGEGARPELSHLKMLVLSGEATTMRLGQRLRALIPGVKLLNLYGPTETAADSLAYRFDDVELDDQAASVPIGRPIWNTEAYVLDAWLEPLPVGAVGEIYLAGAGLARGYLGRGDLTAERFVPHPFSQLAGQRLYRTGDLGRRLADGSLECLGRVDQQVKVRGHRIELGEVEAVLLRHPEVKEVVVAVKDYGEADRRLVAYVVKRGAQPLSVEELRHWVGERLPGYMVPGLWVWLERLPLNANGKADRRALPEPQPGAEQSSGGIRGPRSEIERMLVQIWEELLGVQPVGIDHNFFELGGDSILAMRMVASARARGCNLSVCDLFTHQSIAAIAASGLLAGTAQSRPATRQPDSTTALLDGILSEIGDC